MKKIIFLFLIFISYELTAQRVVYDTILTVTSAITDTVLLVPMKKVGGRYIEVDFNTLSHNTDTIDVGYALDGYSFESFEQIGGLTFPVVADKNTFRAYDSDVTYKARFGIRDTDFLAKYFAVRYRRVGSTSGYIVLIY